MKSPLYRLVGVVFALLAALLAGCAQAPAAPVDPNQSSWHGRLALRVQTSEPTSYFANFELAGQADRGELLLSTPLGTTLAQLRWSPQYTLLQGDGQTRAFESLDALAVEATGTAIPIAALFDWLRGRDIEVPGWQADLSQLAEGRLVARRVQPEPAAELKLILDQP